MATRPSSKVQPATPRPPRHNRQYSSSPSKAFWHAVCIHPDVGARGCFALLPIGCMSFARHLMSAPRILIVDDDYSLCAVVEKLLVREGYQVHTATDTAVA